MYIRTTIIIISAESLIIQTLELTSIKVFCFELDYYNSSRLATNYSVQAHGISQDITCTHTIVKYNHFLYTPPFNTGGIKQQNYKKNGLIKF